MSSHIIHNNTPFPSRRPPLLADSQAFDSQNEFTSVRVLATPLNCKNPRRRIRCAEAGASGRARGADSRAGTHPGSGFPDLKARGCALPHTKTHDRAIAVGLCCALSTKRQLGLAPPSLSAVKCAAIFQLGWLGAESRGFCVFRSSPPRLLRCSPRRVRHVVALELMTQPCVRGPPPRSGRAHGRPAPLDW